MKDSGIPWIGNIPEDWEVARFKMLGAFTKGKLPKSTNTENIGFPIIGAAEMGGKAPRNFTDDPECPKCAENDVLILWDGANAGFVATGIPGVLSSTVVKYRSPLSQNSFRYVFYLFKYFENYFRSKVGGTTIPHMNPAFIDECPFLLPPAGTQKRIAEFLDKKCAEIDALIALQEKMIAELKSYKQSVITEAVTRGVPAQNPNKSSHGDTKTRSLAGTQNNTFPNQKSAEPALERQRKTSLNAPRPRASVRDKMKDSGIPWLGSIPAHWEVRKLKTLGKLQGGNGFPEEHQGIFDEEISFIKVKALIEDPIQKTGKDTISERTRNQLKATLIPKNSIVFAKVGAALLLQRFRRLNFSCCIDNNMMSFSPSKNVLPDYFVYVSTLFDFSLFVNPGTVPSVNQEQVGNIFIPLPDINEQERIVDFLDSKTSEIDSMISLKQQKIATLQNYKKSVIFEYVTGKKII